MCVYVYAYKRKEQEVERMLSEITPQEGNSEK